MIYVWHEEIKKMNVHKTYETFWNSIDYTYIVQKGLLKSVIMVDEDTLTWNN